MRVSVGLVPVRPLPWRSQLPWYWTDDLARILHNEGQISDKVAVLMTQTPVAIRSDEPTREAAARTLLDDDEIPLAA